MRIDELTQNVTKVNRLWEKKIVIAMGVLKMLVLMKPLKKSEQQNEFIVHVL